jgi:serine phosphatase RsbU (regulator of sigma subunit)
MGDDEQQPPMSALCLDVTLPCEVRYLPVLNRLAEQAVDYTGYDKMVREEMLRVVEAAVRRVLDSDAYQKVGLRLATTDSDMLIRIRCFHAAAVERSMSIEQLLSKADADETPLGRLRQVMTTVTLGCEEGEDRADFCELTKALPKAL